MSLRVWLPLTGDLRNQGISEITFSGTSTWQSFGKIGSKAYNLSTRTSFNCPALANIKYFSVAFWCMIEPNTESTANWMDILSLTDKSTNDTTGYFRFETGYGNTAYGGVHWHDNATNAIINGAYTYNTASEQNQWHHIVVTVSNTAVCSYYDGILKQTNTSNLNGGHLTGAGWIGESTTRGSIQDVRIYDHCLSAAEVKEIAQGLVLHYKLNGNSGSTNVNLLPCGDTYTKSSPRTVTSANTDGYSWVPNSAFEAKPSTTYTISVECDGILSNTHGNGGINLEQKPWTFWLYICNVDTTKNWSNGQYDTPVNLTSANNNYRKIGNAHVWTYTLSSTQKYISLRTNNYSNGSTSITINYWNMKIEEGNTYTPWMPSYMNNTNNIQDSSGYNHNGTILNTVSISSDTPRYSYSTKLEAANSMINCGRGGMVTDSITVNIWFKTSGWGNPVSCTEGGGWNFEASGDYFRFPIYISGVGYKYGQSTHTRAQLCNNQWHMLTGMYDRINGRVKIYVDGELDNDFDAQTHNNIAYHPSNCIWIGAEATGSNTTASNGMAGLFSDFRIYCTPLLDTDIKQLYNVAMKVDKSQQIHAFDTDEQLFNIMYKPNFAIGAQIWQDGLNRYTQSNCQVNLTNDGVYVYRPANLNQTDNGNTMYGGLKIVNSTVDNIHVYDSTIDNIFNLQKGHTYIWIFHIKGNTTNAPSFQINNNMGWGGGGLSPTPSNVTIKNISSNFNGETEVWYKFTINDDIVKTCTSAYSSFIANNQYLSYKHFGWNWIYATTGNGTNIYITNIRLYDITNMPIGKLTKSGIIKFSSIFEVNSTIHLTKNEDLILNQFIER